MQLIGNFSGHPSNSRYTVFTFYRKDQADCFKTLLIENDIWFEEDIEEREYNNKYLFGVKNKDLKEARRLNYIAFGKFREPFIANVYFRWFVIILSILVMTIAIIGFVKTEL